ncbi:MAG: ABC transporter substrate-binding protein [Blastochloris sp.]|nr:ABC transporter substrate-binding protein [Blastochloris sp.]
MTGSVNSMTSSHYRPSFAQPLTIRKPDLPGLNAQLLLKQPGRAFYLEEEGIPTYDELVFVAHRSQLDEPHLLSFMRAVERGVLYSINHPDEAWAVVIERYPQLDGELNRRAWRDTLPRFALRPAALIAGAWRARIRRREHHRRRRMASACSSRAGFCAIDQVMKPQPMRALPAAANSRFNHSASP